MNLLSRLTIWFLFYSRTTILYATASWQEPDGKTDPELVSRIVGGNDAAWGEFPFLVSWYWNFRDPPGCGGSLVAPNLVLTAGHCQNLSGPISIGNRYANPTIDPTESVETRTVIRKILHPAFNKPRKLYNDILLLELNADVDTDLFPPIDLNFDKQQPSDGKMLTVIGFGLTYEGGKAASTLQKVDVPTVSREGCKRKYGGLVQDEIHLCAGAEKGKDACAGDSGGPLVGHINGVLTQVGITSWGIGCAREGMPGVYSRISGADDWLRNEICSRSHEPKPSYCARIIISTPPPTRPPTKLPTKVPTNWPTVKPTISSSTLHPSSRPLTPEPTTSVPTVQPTPAPTSGPITQCKSCTDTEASWMVNQEEECTSSTDTLERLCNKNDYWIRNRICEFSCYLAGYGYSGEECCITDAIFATAAPSPVAYISDIDHDPVDTVYLGYPPGCEICSDVGNDWMVMVGNECPSSYLLKNKCNKNVAWSNAKFCQLSCYEAGYGYNGDVCCDKGGRTVAPTTLSPTTSNPTSSSPTTPSPTTSTPTTLSPTTGIPTVTPQTPLPTTSTPTTLSPTTDIPTLHPPTPLPKTSKPTTFSPTVVIPTFAPVTASPATPIPTLSPTTMSPTTMSPTTLPPTSSPTTALPTTLSPTFSPTATPTVSCIECNDIGNSWMQDQNVPCHPDNILIERKCNKNITWKREKSCQYTCYITGNGYDGDVCCPKISI